jgi:hypothetical protein
MHVNQRETPHGDGASPPLAGSEEGGMVCDIW